jgi:AcrR family transcriptional regulator
MTDARYERSRAAVFDAVCSVLVTEGLPGLTVDRLAAESHVSRSTIYRNWPDLAALACDVFRDLVDRDAVDVGGDPCVALHDYLEDYARRLNDPTYTAVLVALIEGSARDEAFAQVHRRAFSQTRSRAGSIIRSAMEQGVIDNGLDMPQCVEDLVAPFLYRCLVNRARISSRQVDELHARLLQRWSAGMR